MNIGDWTIIILTITGCLSFVLCLVAFLLTFDFDNLKDRIFKSHKKVKE